MLIEDLHYTLRPENLEGTPREIRLGRRDRGRLLVVDRAQAKWTESSVQELPRWMRAGDVVVLNNSKRIPGILKGRTTVGGQVELWFVDLGENGTAICSIFPKHDVHAGSGIHLRGGHVVRVLEIGVTKYDLATVRGETSSIRDLLKTQGLPISSFFYEGHWELEHFNPYFATEEGSVESPLAGLHFTPQLVKALETAGVIVCFITLHSIGSWLPFLEANVKDHQIWPEFFQIPPETAAIINRARSLGGRICACGSTSLRALESAVIEGGCVTVTTGRTNLYITPGYEFRVVDAYFTNFHQHQTSLIVLDAAFCGRDLLKKIYLEGRNRHYSFYEFGDALLYV